MYQKDNEGFIKGPDGIKRYVPAGLSLHASGCGWYATTYTEFGDRICVYFGVRRDGSLQKAYENAMQYLKDNSEAIDSFSYSGLNRLGRRIAELEQMSIKYADRDHMPMGISYRKASSSSLSITVSLVDSHKTVTVPIGDSCVWEATVAELRVMRLDKLQRLAEQRHQYATELLSI